MISWLRDVITFQLKHGGMNPETQGTTSDLIRRRRALMDEEWKEVCQAMRQFEWYTGSQKRSALWARTKSIDTTISIESHMAAELVDLMYTILGTFAEFDIDPQPVWDAIHAANMAKEVNPDDGKALKGEGWEKARFVLRGLMPLQSRGADFDPNHVGTPSRAAPPAKPLVRAIGVLSERTQRRFQVGSIDDNLPERKSKCSLPECKGGHGDC